MKRWLSVLRDEGVIAPATLTLHNRIFTEFGDNLRTERGLAPRSIAGQSAIIRRFLHEVCPTGADELGKIGQDSAIGYTSVMLGMAALVPGRRCAGRCAPFSVTSIIGG